MDRLEFRQIFLSMSSLFELDWNGQVIFDNGESGRPDIVCRPEVTSRLVTFNVNVQAWPGILASYQKRYGITSESDVVWLVANHEWAHLIVNYHPGVLNMEEIQVSHINRACYMLKFGLISLSGAENESQIFDTAYELTWLSENDWRIRVEETSDIIDGRAAYAKSKFRQNIGHYSSLGAREAVLMLDRVKMTETGLMYKDAVLGELFRIVLNPFGDKLNERMIDWKVARIMTAMNSLGW